MDRRPVVLHVMDKFGVRGSSIHGVTRLLSWWFPRFDARRYRVRLIGLRPRDAASDHLAQQGVDVQVLGKSKFDPSTLSALVGLIRQERARIVHLHGYGASNFGRVAARLTGVRTIVHEHFVDPAMPGYQGIVDAALARWTDRGIAVSQSVKTFMVAKRRLPAVRVQVIFNGAPLEEFRARNGAEVEALRARWGIPEGVPVLGTVGRIDEQKGNRYLLEAAAALRRAGRRVKVMLVGDGPLLGALQAQCRAAGLEQDVIFTGFQEDIPALQSLFTIQVFPSLWEGTPLTLFEAMGTGRAIVATTADGLGEVLTDGHNARLVAPRDAAGLGAALDSVLADPAQAARLAAQALADSGRFHIQRSVDAMQAMYDELLAAGAVSGAPRG